MRSALGRRSHEDQNALAIFLQANVEVDAVGPQVDVMLPFQEAMDPFFEFGLPDLFEPRDRRGAEALPARTDQSGNRFAEVARADALELEPGNQLFELRVFPR